MSTIQGKFSLTGWISVSLPALRIKSHVGTLLVAISGMILGSASVEAQLPATPQPVNHLHQVGRIRVFFHTDGKHAVNPADLNQNGVPDQVEDAAAQTQAAYLFFVDTLGFPDPFKTERYRNAAFLDIIFRHKDLLRSNGKAYDEVQRFKRAGDPPDTLSLSFSLATSVDASSNLTPAHEFFHIIQNSVTYFKNSWYTEGMARWSERALGLGAVGPVRYDGPWPLPEKTREALFEKSYDAAEEFWNVLASKDDPKGEIPESKVSAELKEMTYVNGTKVLRDFRFQGWRLMREVLLELDKADDVAFRELGYDRWSEANQRSSRNNPFILQAVMRAVSARSDNPLSYVSKQTRR